MGNLARFRDQWLSHPLWSYVRWQREFKASLNAVIAQQDEARVIEDEAWGTVYLHSKWRYITTKMSTPEREAAADAVERWNAKLNAHDDNIGPMDQTVLRWWKYSD